MKRMGVVIGIKPERIAEYKKTHAAVWPEVLAKISDCNIKNYTIFLREPENLLFGYFEYHGDDWVADTAKTKRVYGKKSDAVDAFVIHRQPDQLQPCRPRINSELSRITLNHLPPGRGPGAGLIEGIALRDSWKAHRGWAGRCAAGVLSGG